MLRKVIGIILVGLLYLSSMSLVFAGDKYWDTGGWATLTEYQKETGKKITRVREAPMLAELVKQGKLSPVDKRLPKQPKVIDVVEEIGQYGGDWNMAWLGVVEPWGFDRTTIEGLIQFNWNGTKLVPNLAYKWTMSKDGKVFTFYLREGLKWSDGEPYTADDILFLIEDVYGNKDLTPTFPDWLVVNGKPGQVKKLNDYTIQFTFSGPYATFPMKIADWGALDGFPKHYFKQFHPKYISKEKLDELAKKEGFANWAQLFLSKDDLVANPDRPTIKAWKVTTKPGVTRTIFERNPYYWKVDPEGNQLPYIDRMIWTEVGDPEMVLMKAIAGEIDYQTWRIGTAWYKYQLLMANREKGGYRILQYTHADGAACLIMPNYNCAGDPVVKKLFHDKQFRFALSLAINREEMNELVYDGLGQPWQASFVPGVPYYDEEWSKAYVEYDPKKAEALLDEMGLKKGPDGIRLRPDGKKLSLVIECVADPRRTKPLELVVGYWRAIGIDASLKSWERSLYEQRDAANLVQIKTWDNFDRQFPNFILDPRRVVPYATGSDVPFTEYARWYATGGKQGEKPPEEFRRLQELWDIARTTPDPKERDRAAREIVKLHKENIFLIGTVARMPFLVIAKNNFRNVPEKFISDWMPRWDQPQQFFIKR